MAGAPKLIKMVIRKNGFKNIEIRGNTENIVLWHPELQRSDIRSMKMDNFVTNGNS